MDPIAIADKLADLGGLTLFVVAVVAAAIGLHRRWWVPGWVYQPLLEERDQMRVENRELMLTNARLAAELRGERRQRRLGHATGE